MNLSIPVIANNVGGTPEIIQNGYNGFLVSSNSVHDYLHCISCATSDATVYQRLSLNAFYTSLNYTPKSQYQAFNQVLRSVF